MMVYFLVMNNKRCGTKRKAKKRGNVVIAELVCGKT